MKSNLLGRRRSALERLEKQYAVFKSSNKDKVKNGKVIRSYEAECKRFESEIETLKERVRV